MKIYVKNLSHCNVVVMQLNEFTLTTALSSLIKLPRVKLISCQENPKMYINTSIQTERFLHFKLDVHPKVNKPLLSLAFTHQREHVGGNM